MTSDSPAGRIEARELIRPELVLAGSGLSVDVARSFHAEWFDAIARDVGRHGIIIFEYVVIGEPSPLMREVTHLARIASSSFDPVAQVAAGERERLPVIVTDMLGAEDDRARCIDWYDLAHDLISNRPHELALCDVAIQLEHQMALAADHICVGPAVVAAVGPHFQHSNA
jgi:hypothetical protein